MESQRLVVIVTGANSGIGYGTCCRLIEQLTYSNPPDSFLLSSPRAVSDAISPYAGTTELTLVVACRNPANGQKTCRSLLQYAKDAVQRQQKKANDDGHAANFLKGLKLDYLRLDLGSLDSVFDFAIEAYRRYPYITHLILNAGALNAERIDYLAYMKQILVEGAVKSLTYPKGLIQKKSSINKDGFGDIWQVNVFGHYCLYRRLEPLLKASPFEDARIEWTTSLDGFKHSFNSKDIQLLQTTDSYQSSKYQVNLICIALANSENSFALENGSKAHDNYNTRATKTEGEAKLTHVPIHPGICDTSSTSFLGVLAAFFKALSLYMARWLGSVNHPVLPFKGAVSGTFSALTSKQILDEVVWNPPRLVGAKTTFWGEEYAGLDTWELELDEANLLKSYMDDIYDGLPQVTRRS